MQPASLYEHVKGRDALLDGIQRLAFRELGSSMGDQIAARCGTAALHGLADAYRSYAIRRPGAWAALQRPAALGTAQSSEAARVASLSVAVIRGYAVPASATIHAARLVGATVNGFLALPQTGALSHRPDAEDESWTAAIDALNRALSTWPVDGAS